MEITNWITLLGRLHPLVVHVPIGIVLLALVVEWMGRKRAEYRAVLPLIWFWAAVSAIAACLAGYALMQEGGYDETLLARHQWGGIALAVLASACYALKRFKLLPEVQFPLALALSGLLGAVGHWGGSLTHGEEFLTQPALAIFGQSADDQAYTPPPPVANVQEAMVYTDLVEPILAAKCMECHNANKQKGGLRLDRPERLLKGGKNGAVLVANHADQSELIRRMLLPISDKKHMPPKSKPQLEEREIALLQWWIAQGAAFDKKVAQLSQPAPVQPVLASFQAGAAPMPVAVAEATEQSTEAPEFVKEDLPMPAPEAVAALEAKGVSVSFLVGGKGMLSINAVNAPQFSDADAALLSPLKGQIVWLNLRDTRLTNSGLAAIGDLPHLTRLSLDHTAVSDAGLAALAQFPELQHLNLTGTPITDAALPALAALPKLRKVHLWQTAITPKALANFQAQYPGIEWNSGN